MKPTKKTDDDSLLQYPNEIMRKCKCWQFPTSQQLWLHLPIDGIVKKKTNCLLHFRVFNIKDFSMMGWLEQTMKNSASVFHLWLFEAFSRFLNGSILLVSPGGGHLGIFAVGMCRPGLQIGTPF